MNYIICLALGFGAGLVFCFLMREKSENKAEKTEIAVKTEQPASYSAEDYKEMVLMVADKEGCVSGVDIEKTLKIPSALAGRYLSELESLGMLTQIGDSGKFVCYHKLKFFKKH
jgi:Fic family protein